MRLPQNSPVKRFALPCIIVCAVILAAAAAYVYSRPWHRGFIVTPMYTLAHTNKTAALTFDDGPSRERTPRLLALLKKYNVTATFFMTGYHIGQYPEIAKAVYRDGHLIGNHSFHHRRLIFKSPSYIGREIDAADALIRNTGQTNVQYFRPPYCKKILLLPLLLKLRGKTLVTGTYDPPSEYKTPYNSTNIANEVLENITPGAIIFLHDGSGDNADAFIDSVERIIQGLRAQGYVFARIDR
ncbi:MAG: polysaccharide deacetylase family protein [Spirochaetes bacterium]|nr:polysaccharide deacetylase family protein [Spirochaetota bacterium]